MKTWLGAAGRLCADCILVLILLVAVSVLGESPGKAEPSILLFQAAEASLRLLPLAATAALFLGFYAFEGGLGRKYRLVSWLSALILGFGLLVGTTELRRLDLGLAKGPEPGPSLAPGGLILDREGEALWAQGFDGQGGTRLIAFKAEAPLLEGLSFAPRADYSPGREALILEGKPWPLEAKESHGPAGIPGMDLGILDRRMAGVDRLPLPLALAVLGGFALLAAGFAGLSRLPDWPLVGLFFAVAGFLATLALDRALASPEAGRLIARFSPQLGLASLPPVFVVAGLEACLGLILGALTLPSWGRVDE